MAEQGCYTAAVMHETLLFTLVRQANGAELLSGLPSSDWRPLSQAESGLPPYQVCELLLLVTGPGLQDGPYSFS